MPALLNQVDGPIDRFTADGAYDKMAVYEAVIERGARVVVPPARKARISTKNTNSARARNETVEAMRELGRRQWKKESGYHQQARAENAFFRYKQLIGGRIKGRNSAAQATEVGVAINLLNRMLEIGADSESTDQRLASLRPEESCDNTAHSVAPVQDAHDLDTLLQRDAIEILSCLTRRER